MWYKECDDLAAFFFLKLASQPSFMRLCTRRRTKMMIAVVILSCFYYLTSSGFVWECQVEANLRPYITGVDSVFTL